MNSHTVPRACTSLHSLSSSPVMDPGSRHTATPSSLTEEWVVLNGEDPSLDFEEHGFFGSPSPHALPPSLHRPLISCYCPPPISPHQKICLTQLPRVKILVFSIFRRFFSFPFPLPRLLSPSLIPLIYSLLALNQRPGTPPEPHLHLQLALLLPLLFQRKAPPLISLPLLLLPLPLPPNLPLAR